MVQKLDLITSGIILEVFFSVCNLMYTQWIFPTKRLIADWTTKWFFSCMCTLMLQNMGRPRELPVAKSTLILIHFAETSFFHEHFQVWNYRTKHYSSRKALFSTRSCVEVPLHLENLQNIKSDSILTLVLLNPDKFCLCKQCRSRSVGFWRSQLIWICTVCH